MNIPESYKFHYQTGYRRTGRTYRMLLKALTAMSEGKDVIVTAPQSHYCQSLAVSTARMMEGYIDRELISLDRENFTKLTIEGVKGSITFMNSKSFQSWLVRGNQKRPNVLTLEDEQP